MKTKRRIGQRAKPLFDSIDMELLNILNDSKGLAVLDLVNKLKIRHTNLKPRMDRLNRFNLIETIKQDKTAIKLSFKTRQGMEIEEMFKNEM